MQSRRLDSLETSVAQLRKDSRGGSIANSTDKISSPTTDSTGCSEEVTPLQAPPLPTGSASSNKRNKPSAKADRIIN